MKRFRQPKFSILANPAAGTTSPRQKRVLLQPAAGILNAEVTGLACRTKEELTQCARDTVRNCDVLVIAGGDGTFSDIVNAFDTRAVTLAYLPLGSGNALQHALGYRGRLKDHARRIRDGRTRKYDLIHCDRKRKGFMVSIGIESTVLRLRGRYLRRGETGFSAYLKAVLRSIFQIYPPAAATVQVDRRIYRSRQLLSVMVMKQPYYGYGMNMIPRARFDDRQVHVCVMNFNCLSCLAAGATAFSIGNRMGHFLSGRRVCVKLDTPLPIQIDGDIQWESDTFHFDILPEALRIRA